MDTKLKHGFTCKDDVIPDFMMLERSANEVAFLANTFNVVEYNQFFINDLKRVVYEQGQKFDRLHASFEESTQHDERMAYRERAIMYREKQNSYLKVV